MSIAPRLLLLLFAFSLPAIAEEAQTLEADLTPFITLPGAYSLGPDDLEKMFDQGSWNRNPYFKWLNQAKTRAIFQRKDLDNLKVDLTLLGGEVPIEEAIVDFQGGNFLGITVSIFNRGDGGSISAEDYDRRFSAMGRHLGQQLDIRPVKKESRPSQGMLTDGYIWISARGKAVLERNSIESPNVEFLRMRLAKRDAGGHYEAATQARPGASVTLSQLPSFVNRKDDGSVFVGGIPMVDQGSKGYCVVASVQRVFTHYGIDCDMHQLAQIAGSDPDAGTSSVKTNEELGKIDHLFKTRFECLAVGSTRGGLFELKDDRYIGDPVPENAFHKMIRKSIDEGVPLLWGLEVGLFPEEPPLQIQTGGGHMRLIIGYNEKENTIIFSDSWGAGHEFKTMDADNAYEATSGLFVMKPTTR